MPLSTTSAPAPATAVPASGPTSTSGRYAGWPARAAAAASAAETSSRSPEATATCSACSATACSASSARLAPPALSAVTWNRSALREMTSMAWVPIEPVDPRMAILRGELTGPFWRAGGARPGRTPDITRTRPRASEEGNGGCTQVSGGSGTRGQSTNTRSSTSCSVTSRPSGSNRLCSKRLWNSSSTLSTPLRFFSMVTTTQRRKRSALPRS